MKRYWWVLVIAGFALAQTATYHSVATSKHLMAGIQKPSMDILIALNKAGGPKDDKEWADAAQSAALLAESSQLLLASGRPNDFTPRHVLILGVNCALLSRTSSNTFSS
jgi:hypothetical protein